MVIESVIPGDGPIAVSSSRRPGRQAGLLDQLAPRHLVGRLTLDVAHSGRDLEDRPVVGRAVLRDEHDRWVALGVEHERHDPDRAGRPHDVTGETLPPAGSSNSATTTLPHVSLMDQRGPTPIGTSRRGSVSDGDFDHLPSIRATASGSTPRPGQGGGDQLAEQRVRPVGAALELGMGLRAHPERMAGQLDELDEPVVGRRARAPQPGALELGPVLLVELVAVPMALAHDRLAVGRRDLAAAGEHGVVGAEAHRAALVLDAPLVEHEVDHRVMGGRFELGRVGAGRGPTTLRAKSIAIACRPRQSPRHGTPSSRA